MKRTFYKGAFGAVLSAAVMLAVQGTGNAAECDALDVFEEFAVPAAVLECESFRVTTNKNTPVSGTIPLRADADAHIVIVSAPEKGSVDISEGGTFVYTPFEGQTGEDSFSFRAVSGGEESNIAVCSVEINDVRESRPSPSTFTYADMNGHWGEYAALKLVERDIMKGERIGSKYYFYPDKQMTRIDAAGVIVSALGGDTLTVDGKNTHIFSDSASLPDYVNNIAYRAHKLGIIEGQRDGGSVMLRPYDPITRAELIKMLDKAMSSKTKSDAAADFDDMRSVPDWAVQPLKNVIGYGIAEGYDDNTIRPSQTVTKAELAQMIYQLIKYNEKSAVPTAASRIKSGFYDIQII